MSAIIVINAGTPGVSNDNLPLGASVTLSSVDTALHSYTWSIVSQPEGPLDVIVGSGQIVTFTPTKEGSYLVKLTVDFGYPSEDSQQLVAAVRELETGNRIPAIGETIENSVNDGWANPVDAILQRVTRFTDAGVQPGAAAEALAVGDVVYASDTYTLAAGLPGERTVPNWSKAHADVEAEVQGVFGVVVGSVLGGSIATGDVITVQTTGLYQGVPFASAPSVGDPVYVSDLAGLSLTAGTLKRQAGTVCAVGASSFDVMLGPAPVETNTALGPAGGVLGYPGSTYPNPNGLAPASGSTIPVLGVVGSTTIFEVDSVASASQAPSVSVRAGGNAGTGDGGDASLAGGSVASGSAGSGGNARLYGGDGGAVGGNAELRAGASVDALGGQILAEGAVGTIGGAATMAGGAGDDGGAVSIAGGEGTAGAGGNATMAAGSGVVGGAVSITSGDGTSGAAGALDITGGSGTGGAGGDVSIQGGSSSTNGGGSFEAVGGGASAAGQTTGSARLDAGPATGGANAGAANVGTINAASVALGRTGKPVTTQGVNVEAATTYAPVAGTTIPVTTPTIILNAAAPVTMTATPTLQTSGIAAGTRLTLIGGTNSVTFQRESALAGSKLRLGSPTQAIDNYDVMTMIFDGTDWRELSVSLNS